ncbi:NAD-dependent epimerase/dehydratase family protein [Rhodanobacter sp. FW102-FHT14D06]|uniref:NAD-dependent epimerase/dehydratase family protein n=2 Tax=unclassified Rhodanobacter TaxID=2621553 RepID=A0AB74UT01_9GAMM
MQRKRRIDNHLAVHCGAQTLTQTCLVTGGAGFIGCAISSQLKSHFAHVVALDSMHPQIHPNPGRPSKLDPAVELVVGDVTHQDMWDELLSRIRPDVVIHLAAETGTGQSLTEGTRHASVNVVGTTQMLDALVRHECLPRRVVLTSSRAVYGEGAWQDMSGTISYPGQRGLAQLEAGVWDFPGLTCLPFEATRTVAHPTSIYGATKLAQEMILSAWALSFDVEVGLLRLQNVYGPGQSLTNPYTGIVSLFARLAKAGKVIPLYEDGEIVRDFVYIDDVARAVTGMACKPIPSNAAYDIGSGRATTIRELATSIARIYGAPNPVVNGAFRNGDVRAASCDITRSREQLDWSPQWDVERGVQALCSWIDQQQLPLL